MGLRAVRIARSAPDGTLVAALLAAVLAITLLLAVPAVAQETEEATTAQAVEEATTAAKEQAPTDEDPEDPANAAEGDDETSQNTPEEPEQEAQEGGQQAADSAGDDDTQTAARAVDPLANVNARLIDEDDADNIIDRITISADDCNPPKAVGSSVTIRIADESEDVIVSDSQNAFRYEDDEIVIEPDDGEAIVARGEGRLETAASTGTVVDSSSIVCSKADEGAEDRDDDLGELNCDELLQRFRNAGSQYGDAAFFADDDGRDRVVVCLEREVDDDTAADEDLPDTGGPSLIGLAVLGVVSALAGFSLVRGSRRED